MNDKTDERIDAPETIPPSDEPEVYVVAPPPVPPRPQGWIPTSDAPEPVVTAGLEVDNRSETHDADGTSRNKLPGTDGVHRNELRGTDGVRRDELPGTNVEPLRTADLEVGAAEYPADPGAFLGKFGASRQSPKSSGLSLKRALILAAALLVVLVLVIVLPITLTQHHSGHSSGSSPALSTPDSFSTPTSTTSTSLNNPRTTEVGTYTVLMVLASYTASITGSPTLAPALNITTTATFTIPFSNQEKSTYVPVSPTGGVDDSCPSANGSLYPADAGIGNAQLYQRLCNQSMPPLYPQRDSIYNFDQSYENAQSYSDCISFCMNPFFPGGETNYTVAGNVFVYFSPLSGAEQNDTNCVCFDVFLFDLLSPGPSEVGFLVSYLPSEPG